MKRFKKNCSVICIYMKLWVIYSNMNDGHIIKRKILNVRQRLASLSESVAENDLLAIIKDMGDLLETQGFGRDPFKFILSDQVNTLHEYEDDGEPSASNYAATSIVYARKALELLGTEVSQASREDLVYNAMRAEKFSVLAAFKIAKFEEANSSMQRSKLIVSEEEKISKKNDVLKRRRVLVEEAMKIDEDIVTHVAKKEGITIASTRKYLRRNGFLANQGSDEKA